MRPVSVEGFISQGWATANGAYITFHPQPDWAAPGENRIGYPGLLRMVEFVRMWHWDRDIAPAAGAMSLDSITWSVTASFQQPTHVPADVTASYTVTQVRDHAYELEVTLVQDGITRATIRLVNVFWDATSSKVVPPDAVRAVLLRMKGD